MTKHSVGAKLTMVFTIKSMQGDFTPERLRARAIEIWERYASALQSETGNR